MDWVQCYDGALGEESGDFLFGLRGSRFFFTGFLKKGTRFFHLGKGGQIFLSPFLSTYFLKGMSCLCGEEFLTLEGCTRIFVPFGVAEPEFFNVCKGFFEPTCA